MLLLGQQPTAVQFELSLQWLLEGMSGIWPPLLLGCLLVGLICGLAGYFAVRLIWRWYTIKHWKGR